MRCNASVLLGVALLSAAVAAPAWSQSLAELARQEAQRRKTVTPGKVYTNDSLKPEPAATTPARPAPAAESTGAAATPSPSVTPAAGAEIDATAPAAANDVKDEAYRRGRLQAEREALDRARLLIGALQGRVNSLQSDFVSRDDPAARAVVATERQRVLAELERTKVDIDQRAKTIAGIQDEARRSGDSGSLVSVKFPVLLVEDKDSLRAMLRHALEAHDHTVMEARDEPEAIQQLRQSRPAVVLTDLKLPVGDGFGVLRAAKELDPELQVVVMTAYGSIQDAVTAMREGAMDFLPKPVDPDHLLLMVERAIAQRRMLSEYILLKEEQAERRGAPRIIGEDPALRQVLQHLQRAAATDATVLLEGESGTGKELFARALHVLSPRADGPFVAINCAAIPDTLLETELFGHEKGAFTGASARKPGRFEMAHRGTLFLDEIGDLHLSLQAKILRALEEKRFERVGGTQSLHVDVRVVAATNRNLKQRVAERQFREDLFFRLSVFPIQIPPLRERTGDVITLARHFVDRFCRDMNKSALTLAPQAIDDLLAYPWPGNVRELQNCIERAVILSEGDTIQSRDLNLSFRGPVVAAPPAGPWEQIDLRGNLADVMRRVGAEVEKRKLEQAMKDAGGNRQRAADLLLVNYRVFLQKLKEHGIPDA